MKANEREGKSTFVQGALASKFVIGVGVFPALLPLLVHINDAEQAREQH